MKRDGNMHLCQHFQHHITRKIRVRDGNQGGRSFIHLTKMQLCSPLNHNAHCVPRCPINKSDGPDCHALRNITKRSGAKVEIYIFSSCLDCVCCAWKVWERFRWELSLFVIPGAELFHAAGGGGGSGVDLPSAYYQSLSLRGCNIFIHRPRFIRADLRKQ